MVSAIQSRLLDQQELKMPSPEWEEVERVIIGLVKEHYRLLGKVVYEPLDPEWDKEVPEELETRWN